MSSLVADAYTVEFGGREPWPDNAQLYQPYETDQILLPEFADTLSVKTFLKMCNLQFTTQLKINAEHMSPSGKVPFIKIGNMIVSELESIVSLAEAKGNNLSSHLNNQQRADMKAFMAMVQHSIVNTELFLVWCNKDMWTQLTMRRYGSPYSWPLNVILPWRKKQEMCQLLKAKGWEQKSLDEVWDEMKTCCKALSEKLAKQQYFFGDKPTELDALVYGHLFAILTIPLPSSLADFCNIIQQFPNLVNFVTRVDNEFFKDSVLQKELSNSNNDDNAFSES